MWKEKSSQGIGWRHFERSDTECVVMLRGLGRWSEHWCGLDDELAKVFDVLTIDNRGFGLSSKANVPLLFTIESLADDVARILQELSKPAILMGVSLGGMIALSVAARYPQLVKKLVLVNSSVGGSPYPRITPAAVSAIRMAFWNIDNFHEKLASVLLGNQCHPDMQRSLIQAWSAIDRKHGLKPWIVLRQLLAAARFNAANAMKEIKAPTLVIKGAEDRFVDARNSDWLAQHIATSRLVTLQQGGHELGFEYRLWLLDQLKAFATE